MIKEAINKILELKEVQTFELNGETYASQKLNLIKKRKQESPAAMTFVTLQGLVDFLNAGDAIEEKVFIHIFDHETVYLAGKLQPENENERFIYARAKNEQKSFMFGNYFDVEEFIIAIQSRFVEDDTVNKLLSVIGNLANEHVQTNLDDGMTQKIQVKTGITTRSDVTIENPLTLQPYRTFREVEQPASSFIIRFKNAGGNMQCALFESDGGKWKIDAVENVKAWLKAQLPDYAVVG